MAYLEIQYKSRALLRGVSVKVILPSDMMCGQEVKAPYKTLYLLPGYSADSTELLTYLGLRKQSELKGVAIVIPDGNNAFYVDRPERNDNYSQFVKELVEVTRNMLPLSRRREDTYIGGISMGGYGALVNGMRFSDMFSKIAAFSPVVDCTDICIKHQGPGFSKELFESFFLSEERYLEGYTNLRKVFLEKKNEERPELFLCCGHEDRAVYHSVREFEDFLQEKKIEHRYREEAGDHTLDFWERMLDPAFSFLTEMKEGSRNQLIMFD